MSNRPYRQSKLQTSPLPPLTGAATGGLATPAFFLRTKLLPPRPTPALLQRPRLMERLAANLAHPVTLVAANAGSGKTTLVADFVRTHARPFVWYQLDRTDADPFVFLGYLAHGIKQVVAEFGAATLSYLQQSAAELAEQPERAVDVFLNEVLDLVDQQLIFVLDDYHHLGTDTAVHRVVDRLLAYLPDVLHIIIISRDVPPLSLARLRAHNELTIIDRAELLFTDEETQELFRKVFDLELTPEQLAEYRERTHGWITALQLIRQVAQRHALARGGREGEAAARPDLSEILRQSELDIFDYFAEEVFADEGTDAQQLLLRISLLERVEADVCSSLFPDGSCAQLLPTLVRRNVFMTVAGSDGRGEEYRLHPLFKDFLRRRLRSDIGQAGVAREHARLAEFFVERKQWEQAIRHLLAAEDFNRAAIIIANKGQEWIATGAFTSLITFVEAIPEAAIEAHPRALFHRAEVARLRGEYETSQTLFRRASTLLNARGDAEGEAEALHSLATIARRRGDCAGAFTYLDRALELVGEQSSVRIKCGNTRGLCYFALTEWAAAEGEFRAALQLAEEQNDTHYMHLITHNLGLPAMIRGDFSEAMRWLRRMLRDRAGAPPVPQEAVAYLNLARCHLYRGELPVCEQHLDSALERCQLFNLISQRAEAFETYGNLHRERGDAARATEFYHHAARTYEEAGFDVARSELWEEQAVLNLQLGDAAAARALIERLIEARRALKDEMSMQTATLTHARILSAQGETRAAHAELETALAYFHTHGLHYYEAQASFALASCAFAEGRENEVVERLRRVLDLAARYDYDYWLRREISHHTELFAAPDAFALLPPDIREQLQLARHTEAQTAEGQSRQTQTTTHATRIVEMAQVSAVQLVPPKPAADLTINMLGPVEIFRDPARPLAADAWTTKRARDILCFIASRRHRRASKDTIIDTFWGEADFDAVEKNFHPTVSHIRKALNSNQPVKQNFLLYRDSDYLLNQEFSYRIDTEEFDRLVTEAEAAKRAGEHERYVSCYEQALALYRGDFMQGSYDEWVEEQRSYYREQHLRMLEVLTVAAQKAEEWPRSLQLAQRILADDQFREDVHCMIMRAHAALGNRAAVKEQYEQLRRVLRKELGVEPAAETQKIFKGLMS
ncbi:MAG TPA: BTAD domain-containing putative transcriptional regulator [Pyrinomonadaceae bacterium]|jgi:ATP/maltotriose-dependent transcriptional regulator MalT/DNA-binding SARP family transcriptional activator